MARATEVFAVLVKDRDHRALLLTCVFLGVSYAFVVPFMSIFGTEEVGMSVLGFGVFMTITSLSGIVLSTFLARLSDATWSRRRVLILGGICGAIGYAGYAVLREPWALTVCGSLLLGVASVTFSQVFAFARDLLMHKGIAPRDVPLFMNVFRSAFAVSWTVGPALAAWVMQSGSFEGTFLVSSSFLLAFALVVWLGLPEVPREPLPLGAPRPSLGRILKNARILAYFTAFVCYFVASTMGMMNLPLLLIGPLEGSTREVGYAYGVAPCFELPFMYYVGVLATRMSHARMIRFTLLLAGGYYVALSFVAAPWQVYLAQIASALVVSVTSGVAITFFQNFLPGQAGTATSLYSSAQRLGNVLGYLAFGWVGSLSGPRTIFGLCAGLSLCAALLLFSRSSPVSSRA